MKIIFALIPITVITFAAFPAGAEEPWAEQNQKVTTLFQQGKYDEALQAAKNALARAKSEFGVDKPEYSLALNNLALLQKKNGNLSEAERLYKESLAIAERLVGPEHPDVSVALNNLAMLYDAKGDYARADAAYVRIERLLEKAYGKTDHRLAAAYRQHAAVARRAGRASQAATLEKSAVSAGAN